MADSRSAPVGVRGFESCPPHLNNELKTLFFKVCKEFIGEYVAVIVCMAKRKVGGCYQAKWHKAAVLINDSYLYSDFLKPRDSTRLTQEIGIDVG